VVQERDTLFTLDTTLIDFHHFGLVDRYERKLQNLGNLGTATRNVYLETPEVIGLTSGFNVYNYYFHRPESIRYYDTRSPYSKISAVFGGSRRSVVDVDYSRNITPQWNIGGDFTRITADKQIGATGTSNENRQTFSTSYDIYTHFITADSSYRVMANVSRLKQQIQESGGIQPSDGDAIEDFFDYQEEEVRLGNARSVELRVNYHLYHQYRLTNFTGLFHVLDYQTQELEYINDISTPDGEFYDNAYIDPELTSEKNLFKAFSNKLGIKGDMGGFFYQLHYKRRDVAFYNKYLPSSGFEVENYGGFDISYLQPRVGQLGFFGEYLLGGNYRTGARLTTKWLEATVQRTRSEAPYIYRRYFGNHDEWSNDFDPMVTDELNGRINVELGPIIFRPRLSIKNVNRYLYFDETARPAQAGSFAQILSPGVDFRVNFLRNLHFESDVTYTAVTGNSRDNFRIPDVLANASLFYTNFLFQEKLQIRTGLDGHFRTAYFAHAYDPIIMQFHLQNDFEIPQYYFVDFFLNFKVSDARVFFKITNLTELAGLTDGYFTTPIYTGQPGSIDFGITWLFYD